MRPAQLIPKEKQGTLEPFLEEVDNLPDTLRGQGGFGSTGK